MHRIAYEAADAGLLSPELAAGIRRVKGVRRLGMRLGNWLTAEQARAINKMGRVWGDGMTPKVIWEVVREAAHRVSIETLRYAVNDTPGIEPGCSA